MIKTFNTPIDQTLLFIYIYKAKCGVENSERNIRRLKNMYSMQTQTQKREVEELMSNFSKETKFLTITESDKRNYELDIKSGHFVGVELSDSRKRDDDKFETIAISGNQLNGLIRKMGLEGYEFLGIETTKFNNKVKTEVMFIKKN